MRLVHTVSQTVTFTNGLHRSILTFLLVQDLENCLPLFKPAQLWRPCVLECMVLASEDGRDNMDLE